MITLLVLLLALLAVWFVARNNAPLEPLVPDKIQEAALLKQALKHAPEDREHILAQMVQLDQRQNTDITWPKWAWPVCVTLLMAGSVWLAAANIQHLPTTAQLQQRQVLQNFNTLEGNIAKGTGDWQLYADTAYSLGEVGKASQAYLKLLDLNPKNLQAMRRLGILLFMQGKNQQAQKVLEGTTGMEPQELEGWLFLGNTYYQLGAYSKAAQAWTAYQAISPNPKVAELLAKAKQLQTMPLGQQVYVAQCSSCHGAAGQGGSGPALAGNPVSQTPEAVKSLLANGRGAMPKFDLEGEQIKALLQYVKALKR